MTVNHLNDSNQTARDGTSTRGANACPNKEPAARALEATKHGPALADTAYAMCASGDLDAGRLYALAGSSVELAFAALMSARQNVVGHLDVAPGDTTLTLTLGLLAAATGQITRPPLES